MKKKKSIFKNRFFGLIILVLLIFGGIFYLICFSSYFQIKEIKISGNEKVPTEKILSSIKEQISQRLLVFPTKSIFLVNSSRIEKEIPDNFPQIAQVKLKRNFPETLEIQIEEKKPIAIFSFDESYFFIDREGIIFEESSSNNSQLPKIKISNLENKPELGKEIIEKELLSKILEIFPELKNLEILTKEILIVSDERINIKTLEDWEIYFDPQKNLNWQLTKLKVDLENLIPVEKRKDLEYIELRFGDSAPYKYRD